MILQTLNVFGYSYVIVKGEPKLKTIGSNIVYLDWLNYDSRKRHQFQNTIISGFGQIIRQRIAMLQTQYRGLESGEYADRLAFRKRLT